MSVLAVCSLAKLDKTLSETGAQHLVTILSDHTAVPRPQIIPENRHLKLIASDITQPLEGHQLATSDHVEQLITFARAWDQDKPLLIHCWAGISRSTAAAYIAALSLNPKLDDDDLADHLRTVAPSATPNPRLIALADGLLSRQGRMIKAIQRIGRGQDAFEGTPFTLSFK